MNKKKRIAAYKVVADAGGNRYRFYCDLSGALVWTTKPYQADNPEEELLLAWEQEGKEQFNACHKCGKQVSNAMFNVEALECVACAPIEAEAHFCKHAVRKSKNLRNPVRPAASHLCITERSGEHESG